jgi:predicted transcriptional regulator
MKTLHIGVAPPGYVRLRMMEIARGGKLLPGEPKVWVSSLESLAKVLSDKNMLLLQMIRNSHPQSLTELARLSGRAVSNLSRTLHSRSGWVLSSFKRSRGSQDSNGRLHQSEARMHNWAATAKGGLARWWACWPQSHPTAARYGLLDDIRLT